MFNPFVRFPSDNYAKIITLTAHNCLQETIPGTFIEIGAVFWSKTRIQPKQFIEIKKT